MNFVDFTKIFGNHRIIDIRNVVNYFDNLDRRRLYEWQAKRHIIKITNNFYIFAGKPVDDLALKEIASQIYQPSYIGLQSALTYYRFIPEAVFQITNITTRRNKTIRTPVGVFHYRAVKPGLFFGYNAVDMENGSFFISDPEKTLLDYLYFLPHADKKDSLEDARFNLEEIRRTIKVEKMKDYLCLFSSRKLHAAVKSLMEMADVEF
jgi:predicted transcriptional regulator of viral defense system